MTINIKNVILTVESLGFFKKANFVLFLNVSRLCIRFIEVGSQQVVFSLQLLLVFMNYYRVQLLLRSLMMSIIIEVQAAA